MDAALLPCCPPAAPLTRASTPAHPVHATRYSAALLLFPSWAVGRGWKLGLGFGLGVGDLFAFCFFSWLAHGRPCFSASRGRLRCVALRCVSCWVGLEGIGCCVSCRVCVLLCCYVVWCCAVSCRVLCFHAFFPPSL